jgi:hypothetical protein
MRDSIGDLIIGNVVQPEDSLLVQAINEAIQVDDWNDDILKGPLLHPAADKYTDYLSFIVKDIGNKGIFHILGIMQEDKYTLEKLVYSIRKPQKIRFKFEFDSPD